MDRKIGRKTSLMLGLLVLAVISVGILVSRSHLIGNIGRIETRPNPSNSSSPTSPTPNFEALTARVKQAVVNVKAEYNNSVPFSFPREGLFNGFRLLDPADGDSASKWNSLGSGFLIDPNGYILTNSHIVGTAASIKVELNDRRIMTAVLVGTDPQTDLAVLKIRGTNLPFLHLAKSDDVSIGEWVAALGSPDGSVRTISAGIIGGKGQFLGPGSYASLLQTDAAVGPENSGGPLVNLRGEVIGVNLAIEDRSHLYGGMGFAIPAPSATRAFNQILKTGITSRGWIGVSIQDITPQIARSFGLPTREGVLISEVAPDGPAARAGLAAGDIILEFGGHQIRSSNELASAVAQTKLGTSARLAVLRWGKHLSLDVTIGERPSSVTNRFPSLRSNEPGTLGVTVEDLTAETKAQIGLSSSSGVLVVDVSPGSVADNNGLRPGDVIREVNRTPIYSAGNLVTLIHSLGEDSTVRLLVQRKGKLFYTAFDLD